MEPLVVFENVSKFYDGVAALSRVSLTIPEGRIVGVLGPNGAGKTTLLRLMTGMILPDQGECRTLGKPVGELAEKELEQIGCVDQDPKLIEWLNVQQFLKYISAYYPMWDRALEERMLKQFEVDIKQRLSVLSPGNRQKVALIAAIAYHPRLLILDEPASGLDPLARAELLKILLEMIQDSRRTVLISSHILADIEKVVDHVIFLKDGRIRKENELDALREAYFEAWIPFKGAAPSQFPAAGLLETQVRDTALRLTYQSSSPEAVSAWASQAGYSAEIRPVSLEDIYRLEMRSVL